MALVRRVVRLGLAVRNAAGVPVRQPLARAAVHGPAEAEAWLGLFAPDVADELNVEAVEFAGAAPTPVDGQGTRSASEGGLTVALDLELTQALRRKGRVRQLVHQVQLLRTAGPGGRPDRLAVAAPPESRAAFEEHRAYIAGETQALEVEFGAPPPGFTSREARLDGGAVTLALARVEASGGVEGVGVGEPDDGAG